MNSPFQAIAASLALAAIAWAAPVSADLADALDSAPAIASAPHIAPKPAARGEQSADAPTPPTSTHRRHEAARTRTAPARVLDSSSRRRHARRNSSAPTEKVTPAARAVRESAAPADPQTPISAPKHRHKHTAATVPTPSAAAPGVAKSQPSLESMTRDGAAASSASHTPENEAATMNVGGAVLRAALALSIVLGLVYGVVRILKKRGYGEAAAGASQSAGRSGSGLFQTWASRLAQSRGAAPSDGAAAPPLYVSPGGPQRPIEGFDVIGRQALPGLGSYIYKVRVDDRILLLGCSAQGALSLLSEWEVEKPEKTITGDGGFEAILDGWTYASGTAAPDQARAAGDSLQATADRLGDTVRRLSSIGR